MSLRAAGFIIFRRANTIIEYLLLQASYGHHHWSPPKGHVDPGESDLETAWRETSEETGLPQKALSIIPDFQRTLMYMVGDKNKTVIYWLAELKDHNETVKVSEEHTSFKWVQIDEAIQLVEHDDIIGLLREVNDYLSKNRVKN